MRIQDYPGLNGWERSVLLGLLADLKQPCPICQQIRRGKNKLAPRARQEQTRQQVICGNCHREALPGEKYCQSCLDLFAFSVEGQHWAMWHNI